MATKRKYPSTKIDETNKKHTLDSDEEDSDDYERENLNDSDIEGGEEGASKVEDDVKITPFNMREELEEGHFDKDGHYHWNKESEIKDNWLDNIDWVKVEKNKNYFDPAKNDDDSNSSDEGTIPGTFNLTMAFKTMLEYMQPGETVQKALQRLGKNLRKLSTVEKLKRKKAGIIDPETQKIAKLTELANDILSKTGNMDIYQESYENIKNRLTKDQPSTSKAPPSEAFDMYADDFQEKEQKHLNAGSSGSTQNAENASETKNVLMWEFKWKQDDEDSKLQGPYTTEKMLKWSHENYFKSGVYVRKVGETTNFYSSNRIDFDLYL